MTRTNTRRDERGATSTEYALLMGFIALVIVIGVAVFGDALDGLFQTMAEEVADALS